MYVKGMTVVASLTDGELEVPGEEGFRVTRGRDQEFPEVAPLEREDELLVPHLDASEVRRGVPDVRSVFVEEEDVDVGRSVGPQEDAMSGLRVELPLIGVVR